MKNRNYRSTRMISTSANVNLSRILRFAGAAVCGFLCMPVLSEAQQSTAKKAPSTAASTTASAMTFDSPQQAADVLIDAADKFDVATLSHIFGPGGEAVVFSGEFAQDRKHA